MKKTACRMLSVLMMLTLLIQGSQTIPVVAAEGLTDIEGHWAKDKIEALVASGSMNGYPDNTFRPDNTITRGEFIAVITRVLGLSQEESYDFDDLDLDHWANGYVGAALDYDLIDGSSYYDEASAGYLFEPSKNITRGELAEIIVRAIGLRYGAMSFEGTLDSFADGSYVSDNLKGYVKLASDMGIVTGYPDGTFGAEKTASRAEASVMLTRMMAQLAIDPDKPVVDSEEIYSRYSQNVVKISTYDSDGAVLGMGSGFVLDAAGHVVTNYHVMDGAASAEIEFVDGTKINVDYVTNYDTSRDVAIIEVDIAGKAVTPVTVGNDREVNIGSTIYTIGYPQGEGLSITDGLISSDYIEFYDEDYLQISAPISPGNSGGPLVNKYGEVIGINTLSYLNGSQNMNFAIPISLIGDLLTEEKTMTMASFSTRDVDPYTANNIYYVSQTIYGISKTTGEKIYKDNNLFSIDELSAYGVELYLLHDEPTGDSTMPVMLSIYDGDYDYYDVNYSQFRLNETGITVVDMTYESIYNSGLEEGSYYVDVIFSEDNYYESEISISSDKKLSDYQYVSSEMKLFDMDIYNSTGEFVYVDNFEAGSLSYFGIEHAVEFKEVFEAFDSYLVTYELTEPDGTTDVFYDTVFGIPATAMGSNSAVYGSDYAGTFESGQYELKAYMGGELIDELTFEVKKSDAIGDHIQVLDIAFYAYGEEGFGDIGIGWAAIPGITLKYNMVKYDSVADISYAVRLSSESKEVAYEDAVYTTTVITKDMAAQTGEIYFTPFDMPDRIDLANITEGESLVIDVYIDGDYKDTIEVIKSLKYADDLVITEVLTSDTEYTVSQIEEDINLMGSVKESLKTDSKTTFSAAELQNKQICYVVSIDATENESGSVLVDGIKVELISNVTGTVVAEAFELPELISSIEKFSFINILTPTEGRELTAGDYTLKIYHGDEETPVSETRITVTE